jgi:cytochrome c
MRIAFLFFIGVAISGKAFLSTTGKGLPETPFHARISQQDTIPPRFGFGRRATTADITAWDIDISPDGTGLPAGSGTVKTGRSIYAAKCAVCHGLKGEGPQNRLVATSFTANEKAIGNYWPYATTIFDYIRRTMPFNAPGSLTNEEVYSLTAFLLQANKIIDSTTVINAKTLPKVVMPRNYSFPTTGMADAR